MKNIMKAFISFAEIKRSLWNSTLSEVKSRLGEYFNEFTNKIK
jgi:hypothetical protein